MRDNLKEFSFFDKQLKKLIELDGKTEHKLINGLVPEKKIVAGWHIIINSLLRRVSIRYSKDEKIAVLKPELKQAIELTSKYWVSHNFLRDRKGRPTSLYRISSYDNMVWMLSLSYLIGVEESVFALLVEVIDKDQIRDKIYECIISAKIDNRVQIEERRFVHFDSIFTSLRKAIDSEDKYEAENLIKVFLEKEWYNEHKDAGWHNNHLSKQDIYSGYWCFEAAAVTCIKGLDDSSYREHPYYPKDLADYYRGNVK